MQFKTIENIIAITVICYLIAIIIKATPLNKKWLPIICGISGGLLGIIGKYLIPQYPADDYITAIAIGIISGLAATGSNQIYKQFKKK